MKRLLRSVAACLLLAAALIVTVMTGAGPAAASDGCTAGTDPAGSAVYYCGVWVPSGGIPVYAGTSTGSAIVDRLYTAGDVNWFYCHETGSTASASGYSSTDWARTIGDAHGATGYVPAVYFSGAENYWLGLPACGAPSSPPGSGCTNGANDSGQSVYYCPVWVPSGGIPVYASTSTSSAVVDHLYTAGDVNWFYCQVNGSTATAGGYSSSNWAKTVGDSAGASGYVPAVYFTGAEDYWPGVIACSGGTAPPPAEGSCTNGTNPSGQNVYYCPVWVPSGGIPVYATTSTTSAVVDHLYTGGSANWFYCQLNGSTASLGGYSSSNWAKTVGDSAGASGYVPAIYFTGAQDYWPGLASCGAGSAPPPPPPVSGGGTTSGSACGYSYTGIQAHALAMMQTACGEEGYIYAWDGGHAATPGPTYGDCSPANGAPNDCNVIGFDCSGLVRYAYYEATGVDALDGYTWDQWTQALSLDPAAVINGADVGGSANVDNALSQLKPGDVLFYGANAGDHVAIYLGNGEQINAYESGYHIGVTGVDTDLEFWGAVRLW